MSGHRVDAAATPVEQTRIGFRVHARLPWLVLPPGMPAQQAIDPQLAPVPNVVPWLRGVLNLRGNLVPVFDLGLWQGMDAQPADAAVLVLAPGAESVAVQCCQAPELILVGALGASAEDDPMSTWSSGRYTSERGLVYEFHPQTWLRRVGRNVPRRSNSS